MEVGARIWVGFELDMAKARKATVIGHEFGGHGYPKIVRPIALLDGETVPVVLPGNAHEMTFRNPMNLGPVKGEG